jgi:RNA polymerase sigma factor, sigma-70 family
MDKASRQFSKIYDKYIEKIYRFIYFKVNSVEISQDLTSETFLKAWQAFQREKINNIPAFLYRTARNLITDYYREKAKFQTVSFQNPSFVDPNQSPQEKAIINSELERVKKALATLEEDQQNALILYYLEGIPVREIAQILEKSENNVRVLIHRALKNLREKLTQV